MIYTVRIVETLDEFTNLEKIWGELLSLSPSNNYFLTWEWLWHWWKVYAEPNDRLMILLVEKKNEIIGVAPCYVRKKRLGGIYTVNRLMFLGTQQDGNGDVGSDYMDVIYSEGEERRVVELLFKIIAERNICDEIYLSKMDTSSKTFALFREEAEKRKFLFMIADEFVSPYIKLPSTWDTYLNDLTSTMRYKIKKERKKVEQSGHFIFSKAESLEALERGFEELTRLHANRWEARGADGAFAHEQFTRFHKEIMPSMLKSGHLDLVVLSENDKKRAILYNIVYKNKIYFYQSGVDTDDRKAAYGYVLHSHCIEDGIKRGLREYDFLPKGLTDSYKDRFSNNTRTVSDLYMVRTLCVKHIINARETARSIYHAVNSRVQGKNRHDGTE